MGRIITVIATPRKMPQQERRPREGERWGGPGLALSSCCSLDKNRQTEAPCRSPESRAGTSQTRNPTPVAAALLLRETGHCPLQGGREKGKEGWWEEGKGKEKGLG